MGESPVKVGVVDIGSNTMRLLITDGNTEDGRWAEVTGLGAGVDASGRLSDSAMSASLKIFEQFGRQMTESGVERRCAIATSASRDAANREEFFDAAEPLLGVRPTLITGVREARLAFEGAARGVDLPRPLVIIDIGGGSTEFVSEDSAISIDIGSVRLTDRVPTHRPASQDEIELARSELRRLFAGVDDLEAGTALGVAGTWTSLLAIRGDLEPGQAIDDQAVLSISSVENMVGALSSMTLAKTASLPNLDPKRAPVILGGALIAEAVMWSLGVKEVVISRSDTLDGVAQELLALR